MTLPLSKAERAVERFWGGYNCSQAVFPVFAEDCGVSPADAMAIGRGFGGGIGLSGGVCGAVTGAVMALGSATGRGRDNGEAKGVVHGNVQEFLRRFEGRCGTRVCRDLLGADLSTPEGNATAQERGLFLTVCPECVREAADIVDKIIRNG
jgi:C_GCAxxG_C_C family probable redox protein